jgi:hypothetical protein
MVAFGVVSVFVLIGAIVVPSLGLYRLFGAE